MINHKDAEDTKLQRDVKELQRPSTIKMTTKRRETTKKQREVQVQNKTTTKRNKMTSKNKKTTTRKQRRLQTKTTDAKRVH